MKDYALSLLTVLIFSALATLVAPTGKGERAVRFALSLAVLLALVSPLLGEGGLQELTAGGAPLVTDAAEEARAAGALYYLDAERARMKETLESALCTRFHLARDALSLDIEIYYQEDENLFGVTQIRVHLYGAGCLADAAGILSLLEKETGAECEVIYHRA